MEPIKEANPKNMDEIKQLIKEHQLNPGSESKARSLLIEGFDTIKSRLEYNKKLKAAGNISLNVEHMGGWIHNLVRDTLGGKINSARQIITWEINNKTIEYNPYSGTLEYAD